ncbi:MAG: hypothetical protein AAF745_10820 [Planctomycetota bacterium]
MARQLALDWDDQQIRWMVGEGAGKSIRITQAGIEPIGKQGLTSALQQLVSREGLSKLDTLVAVGRDQAELRQMQFPDVPDEELPDMVRFQAIRTFASAGENAVVDYLPSRTVAGGDASSSISAIVSASGPAKLDPVRRVIDQAGLTLRRLALRPVAAAALFQLSALDAPQFKDRLSELARSTLALIDLVGDEAELVLFRGREVAFVRGVRLPSDSASPMTSLAGEIRRSRMACGGGAGPCHLVMWGKADRHAEQLETLAERLSDDGSHPKYQAIDPLDLVSVDADIRTSLGETVGRLAPLVGILVADAGHPEYLIDFENPRQAPDQSVDRTRLAMMVGIPVVLLLAVVYGVYAQLSSLTRQINQAENELVVLREQAGTAKRSIERTGRVDSFLDGDVFWIDELSRVAKSMPPAEDLIVSQISAVADPRSGGGRITVAGRVTSPEVIDKLESGLRDEDHSVIGDGASQLETGDAYRWRIRETITISPDSVRRLRYDRMRPEQQSATNEQTSIEPSENQTGDASSNDKTANATQDEVSK